MNTFTSLQALYVEIDKQRNLVRKIESIISSQDLSLITEVQHLLRLKRLKEERTRLDDLNEQLNESIDTLSIPAVWMTT